MPDYIVPNNTETMPVKDFLRRQAGLSLTLWRKVKHSGTVLLNGQPTHPHALAYPGSIITVTWPEETSMSPEPLPLTVLFEDDYIIVIDKPAGMLVHPASTQSTGTLANAVIYYYQSKGYTFGFHPVNRLDRNTSGLVLIAKRPDIQHWFNQHNDKIMKTYIAVAAGIPDPLQGTIDAPIGRKSGSIVEREVQPSGQHAITHYKVLGTLNDASLLEVSLVTGRTHQIRVHLSFINCPLLGDDLYGGSKDLIDRQALHAAKLSLLHPVTKTTIEINSPLPADMDLLIHKLGFCS